MDKAFFAVEECDPDSSRGLDVPAAFLSLAAPAGGTGALADETVLWPARTFITRPLLMTYAIPDLSMPYNVCCFSSTVLVVFVLSTLKSLTVPLDGPPEAARGGAAGRGKVVAKLAAIGLGTLYMALLIDRPLREGVEEALGVDLGWVFE